MTRSVSKRAAFIQLALVSSAASAGPSIAPLEALLSREGPNPVLTKYFDCGPLGQPQYEQVAQGHLSWLKLASELTVPAQGCQLQLLQDSLARALVASPAAVLELVDSSSKLEAKRICVPFLSSDELREQHLVQLKRSERALLSVQAAQLRNARSSCLAEVTRARGRLE